MMWQSLRWAVGLVLALAPLAGAAADADAALRAFYQRRLDTSFRLEPTTATLLGDHRFDDQLEDVSKASRARWVAETRATLKALPKAVEYRALSRDSQIDFEIFRHDLQASLWLNDNTRPFEEDPRVYGTYVSDSVYSLLAQSTRPKEENIRNAIARMRKIPAILDEAERTLSHPPRSILETAIRQNKGAIAFYESEVLELAGETPQRAELQAAAAPVVDRLKRYQEFLEHDLMPRATGEWRLGRKRFAQKLEWVLDAGVGADQVLGGTRAIGTEGKLTGLRLGLRHQLGHALGCDAGAHHQHIRHLGHDADRRQIFLEVVGQLGVGAGGNGVVHRSHEKGVAVGPGLGDEVRSEGSARAGLAFDEHRLPQSRGKLLSDGPS